MFSWTKKNDSKKRPKKRGGGGSPALNEFGIPINQSSGNDEELEAELLALTGGVMTMEDDLELNDEGSDVESELMKILGEGKGKKKSKKHGSSAPIEADVSADVGEMDMNDDIGDDDGEVDENDPELLGELMGLTEADDEVEEEEEDEPSSEEKEKPEKKEITVTDMLMERLNMYKTAEAKAKENNESSRARRFARGIKTLQQLIKKAQAGQPVLPSEIPPVIATNLKPAPPPPPVRPPTPPPEEVPEEDAVPPEEDVPVDQMGEMSITKEEEDERRIRVPTPPVEESEEENPWLPVLRARRDQYKAIALSAKKNGDLETALKNVKCVKQISAMIEAVERGEDIDEDEVPPPPGQTKIRTVPPPPVAPVPKRVDTVTPLKFRAPDDIDEIPTTVMQALNQRLRIYKGYLRKSEEMGDEPGIKKNKKIVQIYMEAIMMHKSGKKVPLHKLPTPPGCPPIPIPFEVD